MQGGIAAGKLILCFWCLPCWPRMQEVSHSRCREICTCYYIDTGCHEEHLCDSSSTARRGSPVHCVCRQWYARSTKPIQGQQEERQLYDARKHRSQFKCTHGKSILLCQQLWWQTSCCHSARTTCLMPPMILACVDFFWGGFGIWLYSASSRDADFTGQQSQSRWSSLMPHERCLNFGTCALLSSALTSSASRSDTVTCAECQIGSGGKGNVRPRSAMTPARKRTKVDKGKKAASAPQARRVTSRLARPSRLKQSTQCQPMDIDSSGEPIA